MRDLANSEEPRQWADLFNGTGQEEATHPLSFSSLYYALERHLRGEYNAGIVFEDCLLPSPVTVAVREYPLCFCLTVAARILLETVGADGLRVRADRQNGAVYLSLHAPVDDPARARRALLQEGELFAAAARCAGFSILTAREACGIAVVFSLPCRTETGGALHALSDPDLSLCIRAALAYRLHKAG